ncbi:MAG: EamA family transporter [Lachnospiraceae bacterium]|nr:EamA family transporter [Lachnospiraceae bacterium]
MFNYIWPLGLIVISNVFYQICTKSVPGGMDPLASLTVTYLVSAAVSLVLYLVLRKDGTLMGEYKQLNWAPFVLGIVIVGLEAGYIYAYKNGWAVSVLQIVQAAAVAVVLIYVGYVAYKEPFTVKKTIGILVCLAGLYLINSK